MTEESNPNPIPIPKINRCIAINDKGKMCRTRTQPGSYFCCDSHKPKNFDNLAEECNICCGSVEINEVIILKCGHAQHKECFKMWISSFNNRYCPLCLQPVLIKRQPKKKKKNKNGNSPHMIIQPIQEVPVSVQYEPVTPDGTPPPLIEEIEENLINSPLIKEVKEVKEVEENIVNLIDKSSNYLIDYNVVHLGDVD